MTHETTESTPSQVLHLTARETAARWKLNVVTLANWRVQGKGPKFIKLGRRVLYPLGEIEAYEQSQLRQNTAVQ